LDAFEISNLISCYCFGKEVFASFFVM
jgi:hypothetical protein